MVATHIAANASLISNRSTWSADSPARARALGMARTGASPVSAGSTPTEAQDRTVARAGRPRRSRSRSLATTRAAAPSLAPQALPAVMLNPSISGCSGFSEASFSRFVSRRGCSSTEKSPCAVWIGTISASKRPSSMAAIALRCERSAHASISSRLTPALTAAFQPTVIDMSMLGASGRSGWVGGNQSTHSPSTRSRDLGAVEAELTPPAMISSSMPARTLAAAPWTAARPAAQCRLWASPATEGSPAVIAACRATTPPPYRPSPRITSSIRSSSRPAAAAVTTWRARSKAVVSRSVPLNAVPTGVRRAQQLTASGISGLQLGQQGAAQQFSCVGLGQFGAEHDRVGRLGGAEAVLDPLPDLRRIPVTDDDRDQPLPPLGIGHADHRRLGDPGVAEQDVLDLGGGDVLAPPDDGVVGAPLDEQVALGVEPSPVPGGEPALRVQGAAAAVLAGDLHSAHEYQAALTGGGPRAVLRSDLDLDSRQHPAHRPEPVPHRGIARGQRGPVVLRRQDRDRGGRLRQPVGVD